MKKIFLLIAMVTVTSCATEGKYKEILNSWLNQSETQLVSEWGAPNQEYVTDNGNKILTYFSENSVYYPGASSSFTQYNGYTYYDPGTQSHTFVYKCKTNFIIKNSLIVYYSYSGNGCISR